jgi:hypothetical protein
MFHYLPERNNRAEGVDSTSLKTKPDPQEIQIILVEVRYSPLKFLLPFIIFIFIVIITLGTVFLVQEVLILQ